MTDSNTPARRSRNRVAQVAGLFFPGLGQLLDRRPLDALIVAATSLGLLVMAGLLASQAFAGEGQYGFGGANHLLDGQLLDGTFFQRLAHSQALPQEVLALVACAAVAHLLGVLDAGRQSTG
ncbi:MAG: hypothetical protein ACI9OJ_002191 [Myxococcota bacterium]|jgi:hypothetical protein